ncbi:MAG TPA: glycosyltransferase family 39 protein [Candidatus Lustribacter sp.]|nr:glycosyltransferase family 39 protein [Candidatus Lustribacter sp.]
MDVSLSRLIGRRGWCASIAAFVAIGIALRLYGIHNPLLDHPGWRQGDTAAIARNFAQLNFNILYPQTEYNGAPPNYVELELQIVPFLAAVGYQLFGVHEIFGRLIDVAFGIGTIVVVGYFARWLFASTVAGVAAMALYTIFPGAIYYSRTFQPDGAMVFFLVAALYAWTYWIVDEEGRTWRGGLIAGALLALAFLAKPVAVLALIPAAAVLIGRFRWQAAATLVASLVPLAFYSPFVAAHAEWHWASGIMRLHVIPSFVAAFTSLHGFERKAIDFAKALRMLATTMLGPAGMLLLVAGFCIRLRSRADAILWGWLAGGLIYTYVVVTVERVDYYLYPLVPLGALVGGNLIARASERFGTTRNARIATAGVLAVLWLAALYVGRREIAPYYVWSRNVYTRSIALDKTLAPDALIVIGHYDPSLMYYIRRKGWMEDPYLWTPFDEESAIRKGARYFIAVEPKRLARNVELSHWLERFPLLDPAAKWPVYQTDPAKELPGAEERWQEFRRLERAHALPSPLPEPTATGAATPPA